MRRDGWKGLTLLEVMVAMALLALGLTVLFLVLLPALETTRRGSQMAQLQQEAAVIAEWLERDLAITPPVGLATEPGIVGLHQVVGVASDGGLRWADEVILYRSLDQQLLRKQWPPNPPSLAPPSGGAPFSFTGKLVSIATPANGSERLLTRHLQNFELLTSSMPLVQLQLQLRHPDSPPDRPVELIHQRDFYLRNSG